MMSDFIPASRLEARAAAVWRRYGLQVGFDVERLLDDLDLGLLWQPIEDDRGPIAAALDPTRRCVIINELLRVQLETNIGLYRFSIAHEVGHWEFHVDAVRAGSISMDEQAPQLLCRGLESSAVRSVRPPREIQADRFASYLIAPAVELRGALVETGCDGWKAIYALAERLGMSATATIVRLEQDGLAHRDEAGIPRGGRVLPANQASLGL